MQTLFSSDFEMKQLCILKFLWQTKLIIIWKFQKELKDVLIINGTVGMIDQEEKYVNDILSILFYIQLADNISIHTRIIQYTCELIWSILPRDLTTTDFILLFVWKCFSLYIIILILSDKFFPYKVIIY